MGDNDNLAVIDDHFHVVGHRLAAASAISHHRPDFATVPLSESEGDHVAVPRRHQLGRREQCRHDKDSAQDDQCAVVPICFHLF